MKKALCKLLLSPVILLTVFATQVAARGDAQTVTLSEKETPLVKVLSKIKAQTGCEFLYNLKTLELAGKISVHVKGVSLTEALDACFENTPLTYSGKGNLIIISEREKKQITEAPKPFTKEDLPQPPVRGKVTNDNGQPLEGATILVKGSNIGTKTGADGNFSIGAEPNSVLIISFIGFETTEIRVGSQANFSIRLKPSAAAGDQIVVVGYGKQKKINLTGSVTTLNADAIENRPVTNLAQSLQGMMPGLNITSPDGQVNSRPTINIRGIATIGAGSTGNPLILVDGMEADIYSINPQDVDNISVLKDASASSIYGSRAPFGVILITTKKGKTGQTTLSYNANYRILSPVSMPKQVNSYNFALYENAAIVNGGRAAFFGEDRLQRIKDFMEGKIPMNTYNGKQYPMTTTVDPNNPNFWSSGYPGGNDNVDWYAAAFKKTTQSQEHTLSVSGGNGNINYYLSANYMYAPGFLRLASDNQKRLGGTAKIDARLSKEFQITYIGRFTESAFEQPMDASIRDDYWFAGQSWPLLPLYDPNGYLFSSPSKMLASVEGGREKRTGDVMYQQLQTVFEPIKNLKFYGDLNFSLTTAFHHVDRQKLYNHDVSGAPVLWDGNNYVAEDANRATYLNPSVRGEYLKETGGHSFKLLLGFQSETYKYRDLAASRNGIIVSSLPTINTTSGTDNNGKIVSPGVSGGYAEWTTVGYFGRLNYSFKNRYLLEANLRYDGTSRFRSDKNMNFFPSVSAGWNIANEAFWSELEKYISLFKIRGSYGKLGNQNTSSYYPTYSTMNIQTAGGAWLINGMMPNIAAPPDLVSPSLTWEKVRTYNVGVDLGMLKNRLNISFDKFIRYTDNMIGPAPTLPVILGTAVPRANNTNLKTYGFELDVNWHDRLANGLGYNARITISDSRTTILDYPNPTGLIGYHNAGNGYIYYDNYYAGETYGNIWGYTTKGIAITQKEMDEHLASLPNGGQDAMNYGGKWGAGDIMYKDINGRGRIDAGSNTYKDPGSRSIIGNITPRYSFGFNAGASYKGFDCSVFFQGIMKRDYFIQNYYFWGAGHSMWETVVFKEHMNYFRDNPNDPLGVNLNSYYPRPIVHEDWNADHMGNNKFVQTKYLQNAAYIRLKNLTLGYTIPPSYTNKARINRLRIYLSIDNLWTGTKLSKIFDPETVDNTSGHAYPLPRTCSFGLNVSL